MKFSVQSRELLLVLNALSKVIQKKNSLPILDNVLLDRREDGRFTLTGSSAENSLTMGIEVFPDAADNTPFRRICFPTAQLQSAVNTLDDQPITITVQQNLSTTIEYQGGRFQIMAQDAEYYPLPRTNGETRCEFDLPTAIFLPAVKAAVPCAANDELRPQICTVCLDVDDEGVTFVSTSGQLLYKYEYTHGIPFLKQGRGLQILIPRNVIPALEAPFRSAEVVTLTHDTRQLILTTDDIRFVIRDQEGNYPNYNSVIRTASSYHVTLPVRELQQALKRVSLMASESSQLVALRKRDDGLFLQGEDIDFGRSASETLPAVECTLPSGFAIGIRSGFLAQLLSTISTDNVRLELQAPNMAIIVKEDATNSALTELMMPMNLN